MDREAKIALCVDAFHQRYTGVERMYTGINASVFDGWCDRLPQYLVIEFLASREKLVAALGYDDFCLKATSCTNNSENQQNEEHIPTGCMGKSRIDLPAERQSWSA